MLKKTTNYYSLTIPQKDILAPQIVTFNPRGSREYDVITFCVKLHQDYDIHALQKACDEVVKNNDSLRLRFRKTLKGIQQTIISSWHIPLEYKQFENEEQFSKFLNERHIHIKVPLFSNHPLRFLLADYDSGSTLIIRINHFLADGYSGGLILKQLMKYYRIYLSGEIPENNERKYSIQTYFKNEKDYRKSSLRLESLDFWKEKYALQPHFSDPFRGRKYISEVSVVTYEITGDEYQEIHDFCRKINVPVMNFLQIAAAAVIYRITGIDNFLYWIMSHGRTNMQLKNTVGCIMNTFPLLFDFTKNETISDMIQRTFMLYLDSTVHSRMSLLDHAKKGWKTFLCPGGPNVFCFTWGSLDLSELEDERMKCHVLPHHYLTHPMYCNATEKRGESSKIDLLYQSRLYSEKEISLIIDAFDDVIKTMRAYSNEPVSYISASWNGPKIGRFIKKRRTRKQFSNPSK